MTAAQISKWLVKRKSHFQLISVAIGVSIPTLYSMADHPEKKRQKRIVDAVSNYIEFHKGK